MYPFDYQGIPLTHQKVVPGNTITSLSAYCYKYRVYRLNFDAGTAGNAIVVNDWVREAGGDAKPCGMVRYISAITGTWAGNDAAGYLLIDSWNGVAWSDGAKLQVAADATMADVNQPAAIVEATDAEYSLAGTLQFKQKLAQYALVIVYANTVLVGISGGKPDQTALIGIPLLAGSSIALSDHNAVTNFKCVDYVSQSASILQVEFFF